MAAAFAKWVEFYEDSLYAYEMFSKSAKQWQQLSVARAIRKWLLSTTRRAEAVDDESDEPDSDLIARLRARIVELETIIITCHHTCQHEHDCPIGTWGQSEGNDLMRKALASGLNYNLA